MKENPLYKYEDYSLWSRRIALYETKEDIERIMNECNGNRNKYSKQHLDAIEASHSMASNSQRRAQSRNNVSGNYEKYNAYKNALEIIYFYPEKCKK